MNKMTEKIVTKNGYTIISNGPICTETEQPSLNDVICIEAPEVGIGIELWMTRGTAGIKSSDIERHRHFSRYWDEHNFNDVLDIVDNAHGGIGVYCIAFHFLKMYIEESYEMRA